MDAESLIIKTLEYDVAHLRETLDGILSDTVIYKCLEYNKIKVVYCKDLLEAYILIAGNRVMMIVPMAFHDETKFALITDMTRFAEILTDSNSIWSFILHLLDDSLEGLNRKNTVYKRMHGVDSRWLFPIVKVKSAR